MKLHNTLIFLLMVGVMLTSTKARAFDQGLPFMAVKEYLQAHPEQKQLMTSFEALVHDVAVPPKSLSQKPVKIAFVYPGLQRSDYWRRSIISFRKRMDELGIRYVLNEYFSKPAEQDKLQESQVYEALATDPDYLVFTLDVFTHKLLVERLLTRERPKLILQNITTPLREWEGRQPFMYVGFDHSHGSGLLAEYYVREVPQQGRYVLLFYPQGYVSTMRGDTFREFIAGSSSIKLQTGVYTNGSEEQSYEIAKGMLKTLDVNFVYASATDIALGTIRAIKELGLQDSIMVNGWGGGGAELDAIMAGDLDVTVMRMNDDNGVAMAEAISLDLQGRSAEVPTIFSGEMVLVEKGIDRESLSKLVNRAFRYSGK